MADLSRTIQIIFDAVDNTGGAIGTFASELDGFAGKVQTATQPIADFTKSLLLIESAAVAAATVLGGVAIKAASDYEDAMYEVKKAMDETSPSMQQIEADVEAIALKYGIAVNDVALSTADFMKAGYDYETAAKLVETSTKLMIAGGLDASKATEVLNNTLAGFRVEAENAAPEAEHIGDVLNKLADISPSGIDQIAEGLREIAPTAKDAGFNLEEAAAAITVMTDQGYKGGEAANALKTGLLALLDPSKEASAKLQELGIAVTDSNGELRPAAEIMADLAAKYAKTTEAVGLQSSAIIFGRDQAGKLNALLQDWGKYQDYVAQMLDKTTGAFGSMDKEVSGKLGLLSTAIDRAGVAWGNLITSLGKQITLGGDFQELVNSVTAFETALKQVLDAGELDPLFAPLREAFSGLADLVNEVAGQLPAILAEIDWSGFEDAIALLGEAFGDIFSGIDLSTVDGLRDAIQLAINAFSGLVNVTAGIVDGLQPMLDVIGSLVKAFASLPSEVQYAIGAFAGMVTSINVLSGWVTTLAGAVAGASGLVAAFTALNPVVKAAAVAFASFEFGKWLGEVSGFNDAMDELRIKLFGNEEAADASAKALGNIPALLLEVSRTTGITVNSLEEFNQLSKDGVIVFDQVTRTWVKAAEASETMATATGASAGNIQTFTNTIVNADGTTSTYTQTIGRAASAMDKQGTAATQASRDTQTLTEELTKLATDEKLKRLSFLMELDIANVQANAQTAVAAFQSLGVTISSTGDLLGRLYGLLTDDKITDFERTKIWEQIEKENEARFEALELQKQLTEAQVAYMRARTEAMQRDNAMITIDGAGLQPHLEAFMWEVLAAIQVQVNAEGLEMLVGI